MVIESAVDGPQLLCEVEVGDWQDRQTVWPADLMEHGEFSEPSAGGLAVEVRSAAPPGDDLDEFDEEDFDDDFDDDFEDELEDEYELPVEGDEFSDEFGSSTNDAPDKDDADFEGEEVEDGEEPAEEDEADE